MGYHSISENREALSKVLLGQWQFTFVRGRKHVSVEDVDTKQIEDKVIDIISEQMGVNKSQITRQTLFIKDLKADSLDTIELVIKFEDVFNMSISDEEAEKIQTVGAAIDYMTQAIRSQGRK
jgi:acyl carrier protein